jgi:hypothetical protein
LNRWLLKPHLHFTFLHSWFNDLLLVPCAIPLILCIWRALSLRDHDRPPSKGEITWILAVWTLLFEVAGPLFIPRSTSDPWDVLMYAVGALLAFTFWHARNYQALTKTGENRLA